MDTKLTIVDVTGSTNDDLLEAGKQGAPHGTGLAARAQTAGRGRRGHKWDSTVGNLLLSIVLRPCVNPAKFSGLAAVSGLAVLEALEKQGLANEIRLKWPNDLVARGRKLGGILVEAARDNEGKPFAVCGIGVNVNYTPQEVPDGGLAAIGLSDLNESVSTVNMLLDEVYRAVIDAVDAWAERLNAMEEDAGPLAPVHGEYVTHLNWIGEHVIARSPAGDELARGIFKTVDSFGRACIETEGGLRSFHFEEASLRPASE
ncbi:biotin--[acetyl-CoA-carboxylase] ligase [Collinsella aerofaciens]|uniref:biotin--[acetyl-CoA-carboxylase] ligase n=1 Tax=Collinsella aerofaciens TaxID=74426 RepID=UPI0034A130D6